jgi:hypothetical protein
MTHCAYWLCHPSQGPALTGRTQRLRSGNSVLQEQSDEDALTQLSGDEDLHPRPQAASASPRNVNAAALAKVVRLFVSLVTRHVSSTLSAPASPSVNRSDLTSQTSHTLAPRRDCLLPELSPTCLRHFSAILSDHSERFLEATRTEIWLLSHLLGDVSAMAAATVGPEAAESLLAALTDPAHPTSMHVHAVYSQVQQAAAAMFDAQQEVARWRSMYDDAGGALLRHISSCGRALSMSAESAVREAQVWSDTAAANTHTLLDGFSSGILSLEGSRAGHTWGPGAAVHCICPCKQSVITCVRAALRRIHLSFMPASQRGSALTIISEAQWHPRAVMPDAVAL